MLVFLLEFGLGLGGLGTGGLLRAVRSLRVLRIFEFAARVAALRVLLAKMRRAAATVLPMVVVLMVFVAAL